MTPEETRNRIKERCDVWLKPLGYSLHAAARGALMYSYDNPDANWPWPIIRCTLQNDGNIDVDLIMCGSTGLISGGINNISFEHPDIKIFISELRYVSNCIQSMHKNPIAKYHFNNLLNELED